MGRVEGWIRLSHAIVSNKGDEYQLLNVVGQLTFPLLQWLTPESSSENAEILVLLFLAVGLPSSVIS